MQEELLNLEKKIDGDIFLDEFQKVVYSTDASAYREKPIGIVRPKNNNDLKIIIEFANKVKEFLFNRHYFINYGIRVRRW